MHKLLVFSFFLILWNIPVHADDMDDSSEARSRPLFLYTDPKSLFVAPDGSIWSTSMNDRVCFTPNIDSLWDCSRRLGGMEEELQKLGQISFFDSRRAIITGSIRASEQDPANGGLYRTTDGGNSWNRISFGQDTQIVAAEVDSAGRAWIAGSSGQLYFSEDFGYSWRITSSPFTPDIQPRAIFMNNKEGGSAGTVQNTIFLTNDGWATATPLETPLSQGKFEQGYKVYDTSVSRVILWNEYMIAVQCRRVFYSRKDNIDWQWMPDLVVADLDRVENILYAVTKQGIAVKISSPGNNDTLSAGVINSPSVDIRAINGCVYVLDAAGHYYRFCKGKKYSHKRAFTDKLIIQKPDHIIKAIQPYIGAYGNKIVQLDSTGEWVVKQKMPFRIGAMRFQNTKSLILWDGSRNGYLYSLENLGLTGFKYIHPITEFLRSPVSSVMILGGSIGCFHHVSDTLLYEQKEGGPLGLSKIVVRMKQPGTPAKTLNGNDLLKILNHINEVPQKKFTVADLEISPADIQRYLKLIQKPMSGVPLMLSDVGMDAEFYHHFPSILDSMSSDNLMKVLDYDDSRGSTTRAWMKCIIKNAGGDSLSIMREFSMNPGPVFLPWTAEYRGKFFLTNSLELSKFIGSVLPEQFYNAEFFRKKYMLLALADYFMKQKHRDWLGR